MNSLRVFSTKSRTDLLRTVRARAFSYKSDATQDSAVLDQTLNVPLDNRNFSTVITSRDDGNLDYDHMHNFVFQQIVDTDVSVKGVELNLAQSVKANKDMDTFDKILVLVSHGEMRSLQDAKNKVSENCPSLSNKGIGQALDLSRQTATYCNKETSLIPELFMVAPMKSAIESALLAFPNFSPTSIHSIPWHCNNECMGSFVDEDTVDLTSHFPEIDFDGGTESQSDGPSQFLNWLKTRDERVIVVSSNSDWHQSLMKSVIPQHSNDSLVKEGSIKSIGVKFFV